MKIYLAGPISGQSYDKVVLRIAELKSALYPHTFLSPMTGKEYLRTEIRMKAHGYGNPVSTNHAIFTRDQWMVRNCDVVLADLTSGTDRVSIGTVMELAWASLLGKHVVVVMQKENIHQHAFVLEAANVIFETIEEAIEYLCKF